MPHAAHNFIDLTGEVYGHLTVIQLNVGDYFNTTAWECRCECGNKTIVRGHKLKSGHTKSCGCLPRGKPYENLIGKKFNMLTVTSLHSKINRKVKWNCKCDCGKGNIVQSSNLKNGSVKSCGCLGIKNLDTSTHGMSGTRLENIFDNMKGRCYRPKVKCYKDYGGRGIRICNEWLNSPSAFYKWSIENGYADDLTIERDDYNADYCPGNCKWIPKSEQSRNRRNALGIEKVTEIKILLGEKFSCVDIAAMYNVHNTTINNIKHGKAYSYITID